MPPLSANLRWLFTDRPFLDRFAAAAAAGFAGVEYPSPYDHAPGDIRARLDDHGLRQILINTPPGDAARGEALGITCHPGREAFFRDGVERALDHAAALDCGLVHVMAGIQPPGVSDDRASATYVANIGWAAERAARAGVRIVLEVQNQHDVPGFFLRTQEQAAAVVEAVGCGRAGLLFDIYHRQMAQGDVTGALSRLLPLIAHIQIADVPGRGEPGTGELNWPHLFRHLDAIGYGGWVGCEYRPSNAAVDWRSRQFAGGSISAASS